MPQLPLIYVMVCCNCIAAGSGQCTAVGRGSSAWPMLTVPPNNFNCSTTYMIGLMFTPHYFTASLQNHSYAKLPTNIFHLLNALLIFNTRALIFIGHFTIFYVHQYSQAL